MKITYNTKNINELLENARLALIDTAEAVKTDLIQSQTMPFDTGNMQSKSTFTDITQIKSGIVKLVTDTPYARKMYFHPEYKYKKNNNQNAQGRWLDIYITGVKKDFAQKTFVKLMKKMEG